jgi:hypothetical protein
MYVVCVALRRAVRARQSKVRGFGHLNYQRDCFRWDACSYDPHIQTTEEQFIKKGLKI